MPLCASASMGKQLLLCASPREVLPGVSASASGSLVRPSTLRAVRKARSTLTLLAQHDLMRTRCEV